MAEWSKAPDSSSGPRERAILENLEPRARSGNLIFRKQNVNLKNPAERVAAMSPPPGPYSGTSTLALVARVSAFTFGVVYGNMKLKYLRAKAKSHKKAEGKAHH
ncbi:hypothetical protein ACH5RR_002405 [Cinchona calisaya]|uniref:ATP synthase subunit e, mitochondrial n=1 Tax=Cinchona calisaya TaxID=153742 RepID=A0ABD3B683_9GENT